MRAKDGDDECGKPLKVLSFSFPVAMSQLLRSSIVGHAAISSLRPRNSTCAVAGTLTYVCVITVRRSGAA